MLPQTHQTSSDSKVSAGEGSPARNDNTQHHPRKIPRRSPNCIPDITLPVLDLRPFATLSPVHRSIHYTARPSHTCRSLFVSVAGKLSEANCDLWCIFASWPSLKGRCVISVQSLSVGPFTPVFMKTRILPGPDTSQKS